MSNSDLLSVNPCSCYGSQCVYGETGKNNDLDVRRSAFESRVFIDLDRMDAELLNSFIECHKAEISWLTRQFKP